VPDGVRGGTVGGAMGRGDVGYTQAQVRAAAGADRLVLGRAHAWGPGWVARLAACPPVLTPPDRFDARLVVQLASCQALVIAGRAATYPLVPAPSGMPTGEHTLWGPGGYLRLQVPHAFHDALITPGATCAGVIYEVVRPEAAAPLYLPGLLLMRHATAVALHVGLASGWLAGFRAAIARGTIPILPPPDDDDGDALDGAGEHRRRPD